MNDRDRGGDRPKKSWRDVDSQRDRARTSAPTGGSSPRREDERSSKQHRAALKAMFAKGEFGKLAEKLAMPTSGPRLSTPPAPPAPSSSETASDGEGGDKAVKAPPVVATAPPEPSPRLALRKKIIEAVGRAEIARAVDKYVSELGWPADYEVLEQALDHSREARLVEVLDALEKMLAKEKPRRSRALVGKLRFLEETSHDAELRTRAAAVRAKLG